MNKTNFALVVALVAIVIAAGGYLYPQVSSQSAGATDYNVGTPFPHGISVGFQSLGISNIAKLNPGACNIQAAGATIAASTTKQVDCQAGTLGVDSPLGGVVAGDKVFLQMPTTTPTLFEGLDVVGASASSTAGYITLNLSNETGATFTWTAMASSTWSYLDLQTQ